MTTCCEPIGGPEGFGWFPNDCDPCIAEWKTINGDLAEQNQLHSAVLIQLFTNKRIPDDVEPVSDFNDRGGWWGDYFAPFETGSLLWTLYRSVLKDETVALAEQYAREALQELVNQGAAARVEVTSQVVEGAVILSATLYGQDGLVTYKQEFERFWL